MGQFSTKIYVPPGSTLSGNQHSEADRIATRHLAQVAAKIGQLVTLRDELSRIIGRCRGGLAADCRVIEALGDHTLCNGDHE